MKFATWTTNANLITSVLVLSATKIARYCLKSETGNGRTLSLQALCNDGSINACTLMLDDSHRAMTTILKANNLGFLENLTTWFKKNIIEFIKKFSLYFLIAQRVCIYLKYLL